MNRKKKEMKRRKETKRGKIKRGNLFEIFVFRMVKWQTIQLIFNIDDGPVVQKTNDSFQVTFCDSPVNGGHSLCISFVNIRYNCV